MSPGIDMELVRFEITSALRQMLEPLILDALFEHAARLRALEKSNGSAAQLTTAQALEVLAAQQTRWQDRLAHLAPVLGRGTRALPHGTDALGHELLQAACAFFRREGAATVVSAAALPDDLRRFKVLWCDLLARCVMDWLRDHDLMDDPDQLEVTDVLVESVKRWTQDVARAASSDPASLLLDIHQDISVTFERGPVQLHVQGRLEPALLSPVDEGVELRCHCWSEDLPPALHVVRTILLILLAEQCTGQTITKAVLSLFRPKFINSVADNGASAQAAFIGFFGNSYAVRRLGQKLNTALQAQPVRFTENLLLIGPEGSGKTELAHRLVRGLSQPLVTLPCKAMQTVEDLLAAVRRQLAAEVSSSVLPPCMLFLQNAHELSGVCAEALLSLLNAADRRLGDTALPACSVVASSSDPVLLSPALARCFRRVVLDPYSVADMGALATSVFETSQLRLHEPLAHLLARIGRCVPARVLWLATELRKHHLAAPHNMPLTRESILRLAKYDWKVDEHGLDEGDYHLLRALESGPKGLPALQQLLPQGGSVIAARAEPWLLQMGAIQRSARGRALTVLGGQLLQRRSGK